MQIQNIFIILCSHYRDTLRYLLYKSSRSACSRIEQIRKLEEKERRVGGQEIEAILGKDIDLTAKEETKTAAKQVKHI